MQSYSISDLEDCIQICNKDPNCKWYTLEKDKNHCVLYENCHKKFDCQTCATGEEYCSRGYLPTSTKKGPRTSVLHDPITTTPRPELSLQELSLHKALLQLAAWLHPKEDVAVTKVGNSREFDIVQAWTNAFPKLQLLG